MENMKNLRTKFASHKRRFRVEKSDSTMRLLSLNAITTIVR